ncbi:MAG: NAD(P)-dependent alcohol dehydrogenase [Actinomycetes bacterium]
MRASVLRGVRDVVVEERPVPRPGPDEVLVQVTAVGVCGSDVHYYEHGRIGEFVVESPLVLGHEAGGRIVAVGEDVDPGRVGERVSIEPGVPCRHCEYCRRGMYNLCPDVRFFATPPVDGAFCKYVVVPSDFAYAVPDSLSDDAAALLEPLSVGVWANRKAGVGVGSSVLVAGAGPVGLLVAQVARVMGASEVVVSDVDEGRRSVATELGATRVLDPADGSPADQGVEVDAFVDCSGVPAAVTAGFGSVRRGGAVVLVGMGADEVPVPVSTVQNRELLVTGTFRYANTWPEAIALASSGSVELDRLVTAHVDLDHAEDALAPDPKERHLKIVVRPTSDASGD